MIYDCLFLNGAFVVAHPDDGRSWSAIELEPRYSQRKTEDLEFSAIDYDVTVNGQTLKASQIDRNLIGAD